MLPIVGNNSWRSGYLHRVIDQTVTDWLEFTGGFMHYLTLLNHIYDWHTQTGAPVRMATFNYDVMLDTALSDVLNWPFGTLSQYIARDDFRLFTLHGSTTWSRTIPTEMGQGIGTIDAALALASEDRLTDGEILVRRLEERVFAARRTPSASPQELTIPALAVPLAGKTKFECTDDHLEALRADLPNVTHVLVVGWRAAEPHAVELLEGSDPQEGIMPGYALGLVTRGENDAEEVRRNMGKVWEKGKLRVHETEGFTPFISRLDEHLGTLLARFD